jgi:hypothetical protein
LHPDSLWKRSRRGMHRNPVGLNRSEGRRRPSPPFAIARPEVLP